MVFLQVSLTLTRIKDRAVNVIRNDQDRVRAMMELLNHCEDLEDLDEEEKQWNQQLDESFKKEFKIGTVARKVGRQNHPRL